MIRRASAALLLAAQGLLIGADCLSVQVPGIARDGGLLRVEVHHHLAGHAPGLLRCELREAGAGATVLASTTAELPDASRLAAGATLVLAIPVPCPARLCVVTTLTRPGAAPDSVTTPLRTPAVALSEAEAVVSSLRQHGETDPLPWLWAEQISDRAAGGATAAAVARIDELARRLRDWSTGIRPPPPGPGLNDLAWRDPVDGSIQPYRLLLPPGQGPFPVALLLPAATAGLSKATWEPPSPADLAAATTAGVAIVICYPAGDRAWNGAAARRILPTLADAAQRAPLDRSRGAVITAAALANPPFAIHTLERSDDPTWWRGLPGPPLPAAAPPSCGLAAVLAAPFTVVVGTHEHRAARDANRRLATAFRDAYAAHAHAIPPQVDDDADPASLAGRNLVLIGNPRSNRILAGLALGLPCTWDHRAMQGPHGFTALRAAGGSIACLGTLPDGHQVLVLDGQAPPWGEGLPLAGVESPLLLAAPAP